MVINIKHFIITIIAIFLSLGIGTFIGVIIDSQNLFIEQQNILVSEIEADFDEFRQKNYEIMNELEDYKIKNEVKDKFLDTIYKKLTEKDIEASTVMVINMFTDDTYLDVKKILNDVGVKKVLEVKISRECEENVEDMRKVLKNSVEIGNINRDKIYKNNMEKIFSKLVMNGYSLLPFYLKQIEFLDFEGNIYSVIDYVIITDEGFNINNKDYKALRSDFIKLIKDNNIPMMVTEKSDITSSSIAFYKGLEISTVDNGDTRLGKIAMLEILKGRKGHFGEKKTADSLLPDDFLVFE